jgi:hypothetical protein|tara:strand:- start:1699 stop:1968 length:270 start_codon:yes stop_codon:yes gene_type:complete
MKLDKTNRSTLRAIAITVILILIITVLFKEKRSMYQPKSITIQTVTEEPFSSLKSSPDCLNDSVYSTSLGGVCGGQKLVRDHANYKIVD